MVHIPQQNAKETATENSHKVKRRRYQVGDPDFKPPDGGWGWLIVFACGFSNLCTFPMFQQFGLVFRQKFRDLGISDTQTTTVINLNSAFNASVGLLNGPVFGTFSYRQVAMFGSLLVATSLFISTMCNSFWMYIIFYAMCYGSGIGITQSANALALNTYFKEKRRIATGLSWSTTALGPIVWPFIITYLKSIYGMEGTLLLFSAFAGHSFMCSLLLQPVNWHTQFREVVDDNNVVITVNENEKPLITETPKSLKSRSAFSSQYLHTNNEDDPLTPGYEITDPGTPMMVRANDGWYSNRSQAGSRVSLASSKSKSRVASTGNSVAPSTRPSYNNLSEARSKRNSSINLDKEGKERKRKSSYNKAPIREENEENNETANVSDEKMLLKSAAQKLKEYEISQKAEEEEIVKKLIQEEEKRKRQQLKDAEEEEEDEDAKSKEKLSIWQKIAIFFDFNLFKDPIYVNLMLGITIANFAELNFSILTPMVLKEFNFGEYQTATFMSLLGATDILVRFFVPFIADKIGWDNKTFFLFGVMNMALGRIILVHTRTYVMSLVVAVMIGAGKGLRTIFMALVIPGHVPLERLPAASGLQLATSGLLFIALGPVVGWIQDMVGTYVITLHLLNICTYSTAIAWTIERIISNRKKALLKEKEKQASM